MFPHDGSEATSEFFNTQAQKIEQQIADLAAIGLHLSGRHPAFLLQSVPGGFQSSSPADFSSIVEACDRSVRDCRDCLEAIRIASSAFDAEVAEASAAEQSAHAGLAARGLCGTSESLAEEYVRASRHSAVAHFDRRMSFISRDIAVMERLQEVREQSHNAGVACRHEAALLARAAQSAGGVVAEGIIIRQTAIEREAAEHQAFADRAHAELLSKCATGRSVLDQGNAAHNERSKLHASTHWAIRVVLRACPLIEARDAAVRRGKENASKAEKINRTGFLVNDMIEQYSHVRIQANRARGMAIAASLGRPAQ